MMPSIDLPLIKRAQQGHQDALASIYDACYPAIFRYIYYRVGDQESAEDLAAEVFVRMLDRIEQYQGQGRPFMAWLYTIAHHLVVDHYRTTSKEKLVPFDENLRTGDYLLPAQRAIRAQNHACLQKALAYLTEEQRQVVLLRFIEEYEIAEIARFLDKQERAIRSLQHRALASLGRAMKKENCYAD